MKYLVFYRKARDYTRATEEALIDLRRIHQKSFDYIDPDTPGGAETARAYDIMDFPTFLVTMDDGRVVARRSGLPLPPISDLANMFAVI